MGGRPDDLVAAARRAGVRDERVLRALEEVPRAAYVPDRARAYADVPIPIPHAQVTTQPSLSACMLEALALRGRERVLEVGTGHGFQTALLARLAGFVWSVERLTELAATARRHLAAERVENVEVVVGDGTLGLPRAAPFEAIVVSAAFPEVPAPLAEQLAEGGRLVMPIGPGGEDDVLLFANSGGTLERRAFVSGAHFVRLYGEHGFQP